MQIVISGNDRQCKEITSCSDLIQWIRADDEENFSLYPDAGAYFNMANNYIYPEYSALQKPVFINSVSSTLKEVHAPTNVLRFNGWTGFLQKPVWELAGVIDEKVETIFTLMGKKIIPVEDEPGLAAARILAMIINEAFFAVGDGVCSREEVNIAMKMGTNYPFGPFEWADRIGLKNILELLERLTLGDKRYQPAPLLTKEAE